MKNPWSKNKEKNYLLFCFGDYRKKSDKIIRKISDEIMPVVSSPNVKFYNNDTTIIYHFRSKISFDDLKDFVNSGVCNLCGMHFLVTLGNEVSMSLPNEVSEYLSDLETPGNEFESLDMSETLYKNLDVDISEDVINNMFEDLKNEMFDDLDKDGDLEQILMKQKKRDETPSLDSLLDKISTQGIGSLTKNELEVLNNYSKKY